MYDISRKLLALSNSMVLVKKNLLPILLSSEYLGLSDAFVMGLDTTADERFLGIL